MKMIRFVLLAFALMLPSVAWAGGGCSCYQPFPEFEVVPHIDLFHLTTRPQGVNTVDIGMSFSIITYGRFYFLGPGVGLDYYNKKNESGENIGHVSAVFVGNIASYVLVTPRNDTWEMTFNVQYAYNMRFHDHRLLVGFSFPLGR